MPRTSSPAALEPNARRYRFRTPWFMVVGLPFVCGIAWRMHVKAHDGSSMPVRQLGIELRGVALEVIAVLLLLTVAVYVMGSVVLYRSGPHYLTVHDDYLDVPVPRLPRVQHVRVTREELVDWSSYRLPGSNRMLVLKLRHGSVSISAEYLPNEGYDDVKRWLESVQMERIDALLAPLLK